MKKVFALSPLLFLLLAWNDWQSNSEIIADTHVGIGRTGTCDGRGICSMSLQSGQAPAATESRACLGFDSEGALFLEFKYADLSNALISSQFSTDLFQVESDFPIPGSVLRAIQAKDTVRAIQAGFYPMLKTGQTVRVVLD